MNAYLFPIKIGIIIFPIIALLITIPYIMYHYHKYGSIPILRVVIVYSFILYLLCAYFLVILPLPPIDDVANYTTPIYQPIPFSFVKDITHLINGATFSINELWDIITSPVVYQALYNLLMFVPLGIYLRYYFKASWFKTVIIGFVLSLFFEITQLTGLYGIYPRSYRLFDVDDLIINSFGSLTGFFVAPVISRFLPSRDKLDEHAYQKGKSISFVRRLIAFVIDINIYAMAINIVKTISPINNIYVLRFLVIVLYFGVLTYLLKGKTIGKMIMSIKTVDLFDRKANIYQILIRYFLLYFILLEIPEHIITLATEIISLNLNIQIIIIFVIIFLVLLYLVFLFECFMTVFTSRALIYEKVSRTKNVSTIYQQETKILEEKKENDLD